VDASVLQTPLNEERTKKRDRQQETPLTTSTSQQGEKRQRLNPLSEEEIPIGPSMGMGPPSMEASASSFQQEQERTLGGEVSSSSQQRRAESSIKQQFIDIKKRNEPVRLQLYNHLLKMAPTNKQRLMSAYDITKGKMTMSHFMPTMLQPQSAADYIRTNLEVFAKDIHPMDQIELHKQTGEMVYSSLADKTFLAHKLQNTLHNTTAQLELEKASSQAQDNRIRSLEYIIIELGHDPSDPKAVQALLKEKEADIAALRKMVKIPATLHPQTEDVAQQRKDQDVAAMLLTLHKQLVETEGALQAALKQKEGGQTYQPPQPVINLEEPPQIISPPTGQTAGTGPSTSAPNTAAAPATTSGQAPSLDMQKMMKEIEALEAQMAELNEAKEKLATLNEKYDKSKQSVAEKTREVRALEKKIKELEKELSLDKVVAEIKKVLWANIGQSITDQWKYIETIHEHIDIIGRAHKESQRARASLGNMPEIANRMINVLNNRTGPQLATMGISNRTDTILLVKRVLTLRNLVQTLDRRC